MLTVTHRLLKYVSHLIFYLPHSTFRPDPKGGWLNVSANPLSLVSIINAQTQPWAILYEPSSLTDANALGWKNRTNALPLSQFFTFNASNEPGRDGLLGSIPTKFALKLQLTENTGETEPAKRYNFSLDGFQSVPFFEKVLEKEGASEKSVDDDFYRRIQQ